MIRVTVVVSDITTVIAMYDQIRVYYSDYETGTYTYLATLVLRAGVSSYYYTDAAGIADVTWYESSYYNSATHVESGFSNAAQGAAPTIYHTATYPSEYEYDLVDTAIIRKIRRFIGDQVKLKRLLCDGTEFCTSILGDNHTVDLGEKSWPVYVSIDNAEYTTLEDPLVQGYRYLTFSGTLASGSVNPSMDIWYYTFKFADVEVYEAYGDAMIPPMLNALTVTQDHLVLQASIDLLNSMTAEDMVDDGAMIRDDSTVYDPTVGLNTRDKLLNKLQKQLDVLVKQYMFSSLTGSLLD
jgi:hypothetical protein